MMNLIWLLTSFRGRIGRAQFWLGNALAALVMGGGLTLAQWLIEGDFAPVVSGRGDINQFIIGVVMITFMINIAVSAKRLHDRDTSGWWHLIILLPFIGISWWLIEAGFRQGTRGPNQFGPDPRDKQA